jgi:hypothetical protein
MDQNGGGSEIWQLMRDLVTSRLANSGVPGTPVHQRPRSKGPCLQSCARPVAAIRNWPNRDSLVGQRLLFSFKVHGRDGVVDSLIEVFCGGEGLTGEIMGFEVAPDGFDVVAFGRISGQPLGAQPMGAERVLRVTTAASSGSA